MEKINLHIDDLTDYVPNTYYDITIFTAYLISGTDENEKKMIESLNPNIKGKTWLPCQVQPADKPDYKNVKCKVLTNEFVIGSIDRKLVVIELKDCGRICVAYSLNLDVKGHMCDIIGCNQVAIHEYKDVEEWVCLKHFRTYP